MNIRQAFTFFCLFFVASATAQVFPGASESTPARSQYFSWINNTNEGATEAQTLTNLDFFAWLKNEYGMQLDIYALDAGAIDGKRWYGSVDSERFVAQFPNGFDLIYRRAKELDIRLGIWGGPDGFGNSPEEERKRADMVVNLCAKYEFELFKFDAVAGQLRDSKQKAFARMMTRCREASPDLILLNHRLNLGELGRPHATTFLWEGQETYIDVHLSNQRPASHHRAAALARGLPPGLSRLTEDHGVCLSSALDYWDDELVLQAFNRSLILSPQIYGNPWLLRDDEFPRLTRIFNLARQYRHILVAAKQLPEKKYGPSAIARGDSSTRFLTLRNLTWKPVTYRLRLDEEIGLSRDSVDRKIEVRQFHPTERIVGHFLYGKTVRVTVAPFRSALIRATTKVDFGIEGIDYEVIRNIPGHPMEVKLIGQPGSSAQISLRHATGIKKVSLDGRLVDEFTENAEVEVSFDGKPLQQKPHRLLGKMQSISLPADAQALYEATVFSADNNALEVRSLNRSGATKIPQVRAARDMFFQQQVFKDRGVWDKNLFDGDLSTAFFRMGRWSYDWNVDQDPTVNGGAFRLDFGAIRSVDTITLRSRDEESMRPLKIGEGVIAEVSEDLKTWHEVRFYAAPIMKIAMPYPGFRVRYLRLAEAPAWLSEVGAQREGRELVRSHWKASNLFGDYDAMKFTHAWSLSTTLDEIAPDSYLSVAVADDYGNEAVYAALRLDGKPVGAPDRAPSYPANTWELQVKPAQGNYTYFIPLRSEWVGHQLDVVLLGTNTASSVEPEVWMSRKPVPIVSRHLELEFQEQPAEGLLHK